MNIKTKQIILFEDGSFSFNTALAEIATPGYFILVNVSLELINQLNDGLISDEEFYNKAITGMK